MRRFSRREQILIAAAGVALVWVGGPLLWGWLRSGTPPASVSAARLRAARRERAAQAAALARLEGELHRVARRQPPAALPPRLMAALDSRARANGIELREVRPQLLQPLDGVTGVPVQLSFSAPFPQAARFLTGLRIAPDGLAVDRLVIAASTANSDQVTVQARVMAFSLTPERQQGSSRG